VDLGLRDVGVRTDPRRHAAHFGKASIQLLALTVLLAYGTCALLRQLGADGWMVLAFATASTAGLLWLAMRTARGAPAFVVKMSAEGSNQASWLALAPFVLLTLAAVPAGPVLLLPVVVLTAITAVLLWRGRGRVPEVLHEFRPLLAADEPVLGDGVGRVGARGSWREAFRLVAATDRRLLVATARLATERFLLVDAPYARVSEFGIEWRYGGRVGTLSLTVDGVDGGEAETHVIDFIAPANLLSIARALRSQGVRSDDPDAVREAERAWDEAREEGERREPLLDRAAMNTPAFDRGLWLLLGAAAFAFYLNPFGVGIGVTRDDGPLLVLVPLLCGVCGYLSRTRSSLVYVAPLNLLVAPAFFFIDVSIVIAAMVTLSVLGAIGLWAGSRLRRARARRATELPSTPGPRPARGSLRYTLGGVGLTRITGILLALLLASVATAGAAGYEPMMLRLAIYEATAKQVPVDGRSDLTGGAAAVSYTAGPDLREFVTDNLSAGSETDGARWELRSSFKKGYNMVSLAHYIPEPRLDSPVATRDFVARKDREHARLAGFAVRHTERVVDGRRGYVWDHGSNSGYWYYAAWFPHPVHTVRVECIAKKQRDRFERLCDEAMRSLRLND
jgi:hypothetical protein